MSLKIPYQKYPDPQARGGFFYAATIPVNIALPTKNAPRSKRFDAIIDSGASQCIFHASIGRAIGLEIEKGELVSTNSIQGETPLYLHDVSLYLPGGVVAVRVGFSDVHSGVAGNVRVLRTFHGYFQPHGAPRRVGARLSRLEFEIHYGRPPLRSQRPVISS